MIVPSKNTSKRYRPNRGKQNCLARKRMNNSSFNRKSTSRSKTRRNQAVSPSLRHTTASLPRSSSPLIHSHRSKSAQHGNDSAVDFVKTPRNVNLPVARSSTASSQNNMAFKIGIRFQHWSCSRDEMPIFAAPRHAQRTAPFSGASTFSSGKGDSRSNVDDLGPYVFARRACANSWDGDGASSNVNMLGADVRHAARLTEPPNAATIRRQIFRTIRDMMV